MGQRGENLKKASKSRSAGRAGLRWLSRSGDGQEAGLWIPKLLLTELSGAGETAPGSAPPAVSAHFPRHPRGEAAFLPASRVPSAAPSHPRVAADNARGRALLPHGSACPRGVCGWHLGVPSLASPKAPRRLGPHPGQGRRASRHRLTRTPRARKVSWFPVSWDSWENPGTCNLRPVY